MMKMTNKLAFATACFAIISAVAVKPVNATDNNVSESGQLIAESVDGKPVTERAFKTADSRRNGNNGATNSPKAEGSDESWIMPILWGLGGYMIGSLVGTNKTYTKMNKGR